MPERMLFPRKKQGKPHPGATASPLPPFPDLSRRTPATGVRVYLPARPDRAIENFAQREKQIPEAPKNVLSAKRADFQSPSDKAAALSEKSS